MEMKTTEYILNITRQTLDNLSNDSVSVSSLMMQAKRIATMRHDMINLWWMEYELTDGNENRHKEISEKYKLKFPLDVWNKYGNEYGRSYISERNCHSYDSEGRIESSTMVCTMSLSRMEQQISFFSSETDNLPDTTHMHTLDVYFTEQENAKIRTILNTKKYELQAILQNVKNRIYNYLYEVENELMYGKSLSSYFESTQQFVEKKLDSEDFQNHFASIREAMSSGNKANYASALLAVRRVFCMYADLVCPPHDDVVHCKDGKDRKFTIDKYLNRLSFYIFETAGKHANTEMLNENLSDLSKRLEKINAVACKGVHDVVSFDEANQCVVQMYMILGDILRL